MQETMRVDSGVSLFNEERPYDVNGESFTFTHGLNDG